MELPDLSQSQTWISLATLTFLEIVLGIDNIIFISIVSNRLPAEKQKRVRNLGLMLAMGMRILLLAGIQFILGFTAVLFTIKSPAWMELSKEMLEFTGKDLILLGGGLFLMAKSTTEIFNKMEHREKGHATVSSGKAAKYIILQIVMLDIVFSFDSILTAVGLTRDISIMIVAVMISVMVMMLFAGSISRFVNKNPSLQILALSFLILIGFMLCLESLGQEIPKGYIYFAVLYALGVEMINLRRSKKVRS
jgi:predicted tellurium resistance membrane protein TerC